MSCQELSHSSLFRIPPLRLFSPKSNSFEETPIYGQSEKGDLNFDKVTKLCWILNQSYKRNFVQNNIINFKHLNTINDVTVLGGGGLGFCDDSTKDFVIKLVTMGEGGQKNFKIV